MESEQEHPRVGVYRPEHFNFDHEGADDVNITAMTCSSTPSNDIQSIEDEEYYARQERGEPQNEEMEHTHRVHRQRQANDREIRRDQGGQIRFRGTKEELQEMRNSLLAITVSGRRQRLQERERTRPQPQPKAAPHGVRVPDRSIFTKDINKMTIQELRAAIQEGEARHPGDTTTRRSSEELDRLAQHRRIESRVRRQEAEHIAALQAQRQAEAERAEKAHQEELDRQVAMTEIPAEQVAQEPAAIPPLIGEVQVQAAPDVQVITSSTVSSTSTSNSRATSRMVRQEEEDEREYWENIVDIKYTTYNDEMDPEVQLHEGVLYWMNLDDIKDLRERAKSEKDPEAELQYKEYLDNNHELDMKMRDEYEKTKGPIEEREDFQQALADKDAEAIQEIVYEYAKGARELKAQWKTEKLKDDEKKKEAWLKEVLREQVTVQEGAATSSTTSTATAQEGSTEERKKTPPRPVRQPPVPASQRVPATPAVLPEVPGLSPRLQLKTENFKNTPGKTDNSYYERKLFDEIRQKSYIIQHPTSQYHNLSPEIKRIYDGFVTEDY
eukprot:3730634-Amphidinium_carterae.1